MPGPLFLAGDRTELRVIADGDVPFLARWRNHPDVRRWLPRSRPATAGETEAHYEEFVRGDDGAGVALLVCADDERLGAVSLFLVDTDSRRGRLGAWLKPDAQGEGYGTDAVGRLLAHAFEERALRKLVATTRADNEPSRALLETLGFRTEGRQRDHFYVDGECVDRLVYGLLAGERAA